LEYQRTTTLSHEQARELCALYQEEWWTVGRTLGDVLTMIENSLVFGMVAPSGELAAFARVLTDRVYKALIFDVIVSATHRKAGLGGELIEWILSHPDIKDVRHFELYCLPELEPFYERWGFSRDVSGVGFMRRAA
jgi:predicted GNAT family N-acyltransferase